jgi:hypothetical protein
MHNGNWHSLRDRVTNQECRQMLRQPQESLGNIGRHINGFQKSKTWGREPVFPLTRYSKAHTCGMAVVSRLAYPQLSTFQSQC